MSSGLPPQIDRSWLAQNQAATFLERGISLPFTTPMLVGARLRLREREAMELVIKDPSGGMGFYVLPWAALPDMCSPTSHDCRLWDLIVAEPLLSPASIRRAAGLSLKRAPLQKRLRLLGVRVGSLLRAEDAKLLPTEPETAYDRNAVLFPDD
jgi:hypothetical protein